MVNTIVLHVVKTLGIVELEAFLEDVKAVYLASCTMKRVKERAAKFKIGDVPTTNPLPEAE